MASFTTRESDVALKLGLSRGRLARARKYHLKRGEHWEQEPGCPILYAQSGIDLAASVFNIHHKVEVPSNGHTHEPEELTVDWANFPNNRIIRAKTSEGRVVHVRVKSNVNFTPKMTIRAKPDAGNNNVYEYIGRYPRFRGRF